MRQMIQTVIDPDNVCIVLDGKYNSNIDLSSITHLIVVYSSTFDWDNKSIDKFDKYHSMVNLKQVELYNVNNMTDEILNTLPINLTHLTIENCPRVIGFKLGRFTNINTIIISKCVLFIGLGFENNFRQLMNIICTNCPLVSGLSIGKLYENIKQNLEYIKICSIGIFQTKHNSHHDTRVTYY